MHTNVSIHDFRQAFRDLRPTNFSYDGLAVLFEHLEELEQELETSIELDVIGFCCDYEEACIEELNDQFEPDFENLDDAADWLAGQTVVCGRTDDSIVFASF